MTKSEFVDQVADRAGLSKKDAGDAVDAVLETIEGALKRGSDVTFSGFGKFSVSHRSAREGRNPATGEKIQIAASRVPKFTGGRGAQEGRQVARRLRRSELRPSDREARSDGSAGASATRVRPLGFGERLAEVAGAGRSWCSASIPIPRGCGRGRLSSAARRDQASSAAAERCARGHDPLRLVIDAAARALRRGQAPGGVLRAARRAGLGGAARRWSPTRVSAAAGDRRRQAGRHRVSAAAYAQAFFGETPTPFGTGRGPRGRRADRQPAARADSLEPLVERRGRRRRAVRARAHLQPGRGRHPGAGARERRDGQRAPCGDWSTRLGAANRLADVGAVVGATAPEQLAALREAMPRAPFLLPGSRRSGRRGRGSGAGLRPGPGRRLDRRLARDRRRPRAARRRARRGGRARGGARCASWPGASSAETLAGTPVHKSQNPAARRWRQYDRRCDGG